MAKLCSAMARPAQHRIELSEQERVELRRRARAEKLPFQEVQRARIVLYASEGMADTEIAGRLDTTAGIVGKWRRRFFHDRLEGLKDKPRAGRPRNDLNQVPRRSPTASPISDSRSRLPGSSTGQPT